MTAGAEADRTEGENRCPFKYNDWIIDGTGNYDGFINVCAGLEFSGTLTNVKNKKVYNVSFSYKHNGRNGGESYKELNWKEDFEDSAREVVGNY